MKKFFMVLGGVFAVLLVVAVIGFIIVASKGNALDKESKSFVDLVVPKILTDLSKDNLFQYASDELKGSATEDEFDRMFRWFGQLGKFKEYKESKGQARMFVSPQSGKQITGEYVAQAEFENGPATIIVNTIKPADKWQIRGFRINSSVLVPK
jgi:hypothetical protein